jgi:hypothetical protein
MPNGMTPERAAAVFDAFNCRFWRGRLPRVPIVLLAEREGPLAVAEAGWLRLGFATPDAIYLAASAYEPERILLHEMAHLAVPDEPGHGPRFRAELQRIAQVGSDDAEVEVWLLTGDGVWSDGWEGETAPGRWQRYQEANP